MDKGDHGVIFGLIIFQSLGLDIFWPKPGSQSETQEAIDFTRETIIKTGILTLMESWSVP